jgi:hypothetical protein
MSSMKNSNFLGAVLSGLIRASLMALLCAPIGASAALEQTFDVLQIGTTTYRNVTVTTKSKNYIFILHSNGMTNIKVADLPADLRTSLGYEDPAAAAKTKSNPPAAWAKQTLSKIELPQMKAVQEQLAGLLHLGPKGMPFRLEGLSQNVLIIAASALLALFLLHSYCCMLICNKVGIKPGVLVWLPLLQLFPLLRAASMSPWWFAGFLIPGFNLIAQVLWFIKIAQARGKSFLVALLLIFPLSSPFAVLYLAFSGGGTRKKETRRVEIMTLETA